ncbi:MAG: hypothetical protein HYS40_08555 [Gemmatimonadetes bacterium]|nr:hypothetical protein [Gemmatimonadota bacterium]
MTVFLDVFVVAMLSAQSEGSVLAGLPGSTRSVGMGGAGAALVGDAGAIFANPAGIATIHRVALEASYERYLAGTALSSAALALRVGKFDWGLGAQALDYGTEPEITPDPATSGRRGTPTGGFFRSADVLAVTSFVYRHGLIAAGVSGKYARQSIGAWAADAWAGDGGLAVAVFDIMALGVSVQNLGGDLGSGARLPRRTRAGFTLNYTDPQGVFRLLTTLEGQWPRGERALLVVGGEGGVVAGGVGLVGRIGFTTRSAPSAASRLSVGGGVELGHLHVDYAYRGFEALGGGTHRVGLRWTP